jgi:hypothetical protein
MYTPDQYSRARAQLGSASPDSPRYAEIKGRVAEFERYNPDHETLGTGDLHAQSGETLKPSEPALLPALPPETAAQSAGQFGAKPAAANPMEVAPIDTSRDDSLPNASKLKELSAPPEYVSQNPLAGLKHVALSTAIDPLDGPSVGQYFEPTTKQFETDMGQILKARSIPLDVHNPEYLDALNEYRDRKWQQAYEGAKAEDRPLTRVAMLQDGTGWGKLKQLLAEAPDVASAFVKGYAAGGTLHGTTALMGLAAPDAADADREQAERNPIASGAGELLGSIREGGPLAKLTGKASSLVSKYLPGMAGRFAGAALGGAAAGEADLAARSLAQGAVDVTQGRGTQSAKDQFTQHLLGTGLMGAGFGLAGQGLAEGANWLQKDVGATYPEIAQLRKGGGDTSALLGVKPGPEVQANVEASREPIFGEQKPVLGSNPTEVAAGKVQGSIAETNAATHAGLREQIASEQQAAIDASPALQKPVPVRKTANAAVDWVLSKLQPEARAKFLPGAAMRKADVAPAADADTAKKLAEQLWKPRLVTSVEAANEARATGGRVVSLEDAQKLGIDTGGLEHAPGLDGVPTGAPPIEEAVDIPKLLPRYPKGHSAGGMAPDITPEETAALQRYTFGKRDPGDADVVNGYLERAPVSDLPHVYRGIAMKPEQAADMLASGTLNTGNVPTSVSSDPITARSFAARNREPGDVGITFKIEGHSARNIQPAADTQVAGAEKELLLPPNRQLEIVSKHKDPANPGDWIVVAREVPNEPAAGATTEDVFGRPADKLTQSQTDRLKPREGRAARTPTPTPGSDWDDPNWDRAKFDLIFHDHVEPDPFGPGTPNDNPTRVSNSPPVPAPTPRKSIGAPAGPPSGLLPKKTPTAATAQVAGVPPSELKVVLEPREYNAQELEGILGDVDRKAKAGRANADPDPAWKLMQRALREDREQFGPEWADLIDKHHELLNGAEQRSARAGLAEAKPYKEMQPGNQQGFDNKLEAFPGNKKSSDALRSIAAEAGPKVARELEVLGATNAYSKLKDIAGPKLAESVGAGGAVTRLRGIGPAAKIRSEAVARRVAAGPTGEPTITPALADYVRSKVPGRKWLPGNIYMGAGALGQKASSAYNSATADNGGSPTLTPEQLQYLGRLIDAVRGEQPKEASP